MSFNQHKGLETQYVHTLLIFQQYNLNQKRGKVVRILKTQ